MHIPSLVKIDWCLLKLSSGNENMGVSRADNSVKNWRNLPISNPKPDLHNINAHTKFGENPLMFTQVIIRKRKMDGWTDVRRTDGLTNNQHETIIPSHYCVGGYKKISNRLIWWCLCIFSPAFHYKGIYCGYPFELHWQFKWVHTTYAFIKK